MILEWLIDLKRNFRYLNVYHSHNVDILKAFQFQ